MDGVCRDERSEKVRTHGLQVYTILHSEIGNETLWKHIYAHRFGSAATYSKHKILPPLL